jgi:hypothetical protein
MWDPANNGSFEGRHYQLAETLCSPQPLTQPHPPILIGGSGERKTLRLVAQYGDACNLFETTPDKVTHKLNVLRRHCDEVGRDYNAITKTVLYQGSLLLNGDVDGFVAEMAEYARLGIETVIVMALTDRPADWVEQSCAPAAAQLGELRDA